MSSRYTLHFRKGYGIWSYLLSGFTFFPTLFGGWFSPVLFSALLPKSFPHVFRNYRMYSSARIFPLLSCIFLHLLQNFTYLSRIFLVISGNVPSSFLEISTQISGNFTLLSRKTSHCFSRISFTFLGICICFLGISRAFKKSLMLF